MSPEAMFPRAQGIFRPGPYCRTCSIVPALRDIPIQLNMDPRLDIFKEVKPVKSRRLPDRHDLAHAVAFFFHDELSSLVVELERSDSLSVSFDLREGEWDELDGLVGEELFQWLVRTDRADVANELSYRELTIAVLSDACHFLCESLLASGKGKLAVAYALLRKPFKENLLLLEWLCGSHEEFLLRFSGESFDSYVLNRLPKEKRLEIIRSAVRYVNLPGVNEELLWLVRYAKEHPNSLETLWTKATHLVTSVKASATEPSNLNFVFSQESALDDQWDHYYSIVPLVLRYFVGVAEYVAARFVVWDDKYRSTQLFLRDLAFMRFATRPGGSEDLNVDSDSLFADLAAMGFQCTECLNTVNIGEDGVDRLWLRAQVVCRACGHEFSIWELMVGAGDESGA